MLESFTLSGTAEQVCDRISGTTKVGLNLPILQPISMNSEDISAVAKAGSMLIEAAPNKTMY